MAEILEKLMEEGMLDKVAGRHFSAHAAGDQCDAAEAR